MFIGRQEELQSLEAMYASTRFEMMVLYGRRRVGKTSLIDRFLSGKKALYFTARQQSSRLVLQAFCTAISEYYGFSTPLTFDNWDNAINFLVENAKKNSEAGDGKTVIVFDEFPYAAEAEPGLPSMLQIAIDHGFNSTNTMIILSGSNQGFMEREVLGSKSPLYGRRTGQLNLQPFDCFDAARFLDGHPAEELVKYYATFGGTPYYLAQLRPGLSYEQNIANLCFSKTGILYEEPLMLLREELKSPAIYDSILQAISNGCNTPKTIADRIGMETTSLPFYLKTLEGLRLVERIIPFGDKPTSRKSRLRIKDPFFAYWYRFVAPNVTFIETGSGGMIAKRVANSEPFTTYVGQQFENICLQWVLRAGRDERIPLLPVQTGKWWGNNPLKREETDIDVVAADTFDRKLLLGECKWRNHVNETDMIESLRERIGLIRGYKETLLAFFTKNPVHEATREKYANDPGTMFISADEMFDIE
ncbi:ATP-binding protein [Bifidobacterium sp. 82T24]|uniref:ATP-binding protein n=1 Tax=Bifidobacterium pluvialisilvae TaxID=2834436 RepID=UPI001C59C91B|nr:ATP-binding protein [Bifidobacterium pluvialisilvae]MBW3088904.1 ATP-binding protein [Bifidobacterium pluvialisilvae]